MRRIGIILVTCGLLLGVAGPPAAAVDCGVLSPLCPPPPTAPAPPAPAPALPAPAPAPQPAPEPEPEPARAPAPTATHDPAGADHLFARVNEERAAAGVVPLARHDGADAIALEHSRNMAARKDVFHNDELFTAESKQRLGAKTVGENVAVNANADGAHTRLMASERHRANIVQVAFTSAGVGAVRGDDGRLYVTEVFIQPRVPAAAAPARAVAKPKAAPRSLATAAPAVAAVGVTLEVAAGPASAEASPATTATSGDDGRRRLELAAGTAALPPRTVADRRVPLGLALLAGVLLVATAGRLRVGLSRRR